MSRNRVNKLRARTACSRYTYRYVYSVLKCLVLADTSVRATSTDGVMEYHTISKQACLVARGGDVGRGTMKYGHLLVSSCREINFSQFTVI